MTWFCQDLTSAATGSTTRLPPACYLAAPLANKKGSKGHWQDIEPCSCPMSPSAPLGLKKTLSWWLLVPGLFPMSEAPAHILPFPESEGLVNSRSWFWVDSPWKTTWLPASSNDGWLAWLFNWFPALSLDLVISFTCSLSSLSPSLCLII